MAALTPLEIYRDLIAVCDLSPIVSGYTLRVLDPDVLSVRVHLVDESFIEVFVNATTGKVAFALISDGLRIYGKDNAKVGWHVHPWHAPDAHEPCDPLSFTDFLSEVALARFPVRGGEG